MKLKLSLASLFLVLFSCKTNTPPAPKIVADTSQTPIVAGTLQKTIVETEIAPPIFIPNEADTALYTNLPFWDSTMRRYNDAYVDTFSIAKNHFRFVHAVSTNHSGLNWVPLQKRINGKWRYTTLVLEDNFQGHNFAHNKDINGDGFADITNAARFTNDVYFFDPAKNEFSDTAANRFNPNWYLLDKSKNIYCDFQEFKGMCGQIHSTLYTFKKWKKIDLYDVELYNCDGNDGDKLITKLIFSKHVGGYPDSLLKISEISLDKSIKLASYDKQGSYLDGSEGCFSYKKYWCSRYKKLLNQR